MFDSLARFANGNARRVAIFAAVFFVLAGAIGGGVANRLDPYGADDPATETVKAMDRLEAAGLRVPAVVAVVEDAPIAAPATKWSQPSSSFVTSSVSRASPSVNE